MNLMILSLSGSLSLKLTGLNSCHTQDTYTIFAKIHISSFIIHKENIQGDQFISVCSILS